MGLWTNPEGVNEWGLSDAQREFADGKTPPGAHIVPVPGKTDRFNIVVDEQAPLKGKEAKDATPRA